MTTVIVPSSGAAPLYTQQGTGTTPGYSALDDRRAANGALQEGVYGTSTAVSAGGVSGVTAADFMVTQRAAGANLSVDINMPAGGFAYVQGDTIGGQGLYCVPVHSANINEVIAAADATNPRVDQVILEVLDNVLDASGNNVARTRVLAGTPTAGATLGNRQGAPALPGSALLLADVLVAANASSVPNSNIRDRRKWARGVSYAITRSTADYTTTSTTYSAIDSTNLSARVECSGAPVRLTMIGRAFTSATTAEVFFRWIIDGSNDVTMPTTGDNPNSGPLGAGAVYLPAAGSHLFQPAWRLAAAGTGTLKASSGDSFQILIEEILRQNVPNQNGVTSG